MIAHAPQEMWNHIENPSAKRLHEKVRVLLQKRRTTNWRNEGASGISETVREADVLLDDMIHDRERVEEERWAQREDSANQRTMLNNAG